MPELLERLPNDQVDLKILLVDGCSHNFLFLPSASSREISQHIYEHWPAEWDKKSSVLKPDNSQMLRFIYRGRFLGPTVTLSSSSIPAGKTTVLHMVIRETIPENSSSGVSSQSKAPGLPESRCCVIL
ncbi:ubiquitin-like protein 3 [Halichondria panicea]|uniref:ubiquitin-like protein 3 n=1 Tax=Halichondria panicea TaxID=6063 RepID=UPI00312B70F4